MKFHYQLFSANVDFNEIIKKIQTLSIRVVEIRLGYLRNFFAIQLDIDKLVDLDRIMAYSFGNAEIKYLLFADIDFKRIIEYADRLNVTITDIFITHPSGDVVSECRESLVMHMECQNRDAILDLIHGNRLHIRNIDLLFNNAVRIKIYDSGIICADVDLAESHELQEFVMALLKITEGVFDDQL